MTCLIIEKSKQDQTGDKLGLKPGQQLHAAIERRFPERRIFLRSDFDTRFVRVSPVAQLTALIGGTAFIAWTIVASAILFMDAIGSGSVRENAKREQALYEQRLNAMSIERDRSAEEARAAQDRFTVALQEVSKMQSQLLASEDRRRELEKGIEVIQSTLRQTLIERDEVRSEIASMQEDMQAEDSDLDRSVAQAADLKSTVEFLAEALVETTLEREQVTQDASNSEQRVADLLLDAKLRDERNERIFQQLEEAVATSLSPLDDMFKNAGHQPDRILDQIKRNYSGLGGPLTPLISPTGDNLPHPDSLRAQEIMHRLDEVNMYRIAAEKMPFAIPVKSAYRFTSGFGPRWGRMHNGSDFAGATGTPIYATGDGVVVHAGWLSGYGRLIKIRHDFGIETRYAHLSRIRVEVGQRVSRGDRIGDMGNSGRSTGTHLHYEVRESGKPVNPMKYIRAARDVF